MFTVIMPSGEQKEYPNINDLCQDIKISKVTFYSIFDGSCTFSHRNTQHLKGIKITSPNKVELTEAEKLNRVKNRTRKTLNKKILYCKMMINKLEEELTELKSKDI
jgi:hypothetical protein